jgi:hypothetical protein
MIFVGALNLVATLVIISIGLSKIKYKRKSVVHYLVMIGHLFVVYTLVYFMFQPITIRG